MGFLTLGNVRTWHQCLWGTIIPWIELSNLITEYSCVSRAIGDSTDNFIVAGYVLQGSSWSILPLKIYLEPFSSLCSMIKQAHHRALRLSAVVLCTVWRSCVQTLPRATHFLTTFTPYLLTLDLLLLTLVLYDFIIPTICVDLFVVVFPISLNWVIGYLFVCILIINWKFQVPQLRSCLHSAQRPFLSSMYPCHAHILSVTTFPPTLGYP